MSMTEYDNLKRLVDEAADDVSKAAGGNKAAGTRVRKKMQEIKAAAQEVRKKILEGRDGEGSNENMLHSRSPEGFLRGANHADERAPLRRHLGGSKSTQSGPRSFR